LQANEIVDILRYYLRFEGQQKNRLRCKNTIECFDGLILSIQASLTHYCTPRADVEDGAYTEVEVKSYPSACLPELSDYRDDIIYAFVPIEEVAELILCHGGFANRGEVRVVDKETVGQ